MSNRSFGILSTFPPTPCGIATFSAALAAGLVANGASVDVVRCADGASIEDPMVVATLDDGPLAAIDVLDRTDVALVQHEYGLYDGPDGEAVLPVLEGLAVPTVLVAHTVLVEPTDNQRRVLERACATADGIVVMTETARTRLLAGYAVDPGKVVVIPHGAATPPASEDDASARTAAPRILTWGLLGPGKGIEWAIDAVATLGDLRPRPSYVIAGATHPKVREANGEAYREMLLQRTWRRSASPFVTFDDSYRDLESLTDLIRSADIVVLPYDSKDQVTSGVLVDAVAAGRPVVATAFPHAVELLASGAGVVVPQRDPAALAAAIRELLTNPAALAAMAAEARRLAPDLAWTAVARQYDALATRLLLDVSAVA